MAEIDSARHLAQVISNVNGDVRLSVDEKAQAITIARAQHAAFADGSETISATWDGHCPTAILALTQDAIKLNVTAGGALGNICAKHALERNVARHMACSHAEAKRLVELALKPRSRLSKDELDELQEMKEDVRLRGGQVWLFQNDGALTNPYENIELGRLPCALGLPYALDETFIAFVVPLTAIKEATRPCVYDPGWQFQELWRPLGKTKPLCVKLPPMDGFSEWLAQPPAFAEIDETWQPARVTDCAPAGSHHYD